MSVPITRSQRVFFGVICVAALLVAALGLLDPARLAAMFTWMVLPPLHANFVGAIYLFGAVFMAGCLRAKEQGEVRGAVQMIGIWTGMLFIISLLNLSAFDFGLLPVWIWYASYIIYPIVAIAMTVRNPAMLRAPEPEGATIAPWAKHALLVQGVVVTALSVALFLMPALLAKAWPWEVTPALAQMYAGPLLSYGLGSLLYARQRTWRGVRSIVPSMFVFAAVTLVVSIAHCDLFSSGDVADVLWFIWFGLSTVVLAAMAWRTCKASR